MMMIATHLSRPRCFMFVPRLPAPRLLGAITVFGCFLLSAPHAAAQLLDNGREVSPSLAGPRRISNAAPPPLFQWDRKDVRSPEFRAWLDNEIDWACILYQRTVDYLAAYERLQDLPAEAVSPKLLAFRAECLLEKTPPQADAADRLLGRTLDLTNAHPYVIYVKARVAHALMEPLKAAEMLALAVKSGHVFSPWQRERALAILSMAAERKDIRVDRKQLTLHLEGTPPSWLDAVPALVRTESPKLPAPLLLRLYLKGTKADFDLLGELLLPETRGEFLRQRQGTAIMVALLWSHAQRHEEKEPHLALVSYLDLLRLLSERRDASELSVDEVQVQFTPRVLACVERLTARKNPERVRAWITEAVAKPGSAAWWNLLGFAAYNRAARETTPERVVQQARLALDAFDGAVRKGQEAQPPDPLLDIYLGNRSFALMLLGMYATDERRPYLDRAVKDAREATRRNPGNVTAWSALGNALELLAWGDLGIKERESYAVAAQAFQTQIEKAVKGASGDGLANLGRCFVKRALDEQANRDQLAQARKTLLQALEQAPDHWDATFWLGRIHLELGDMDAAAKSFVTAVNHQPHGLYNALRVGRVLANKPELCKELLQRVLPDDPAQCQASHAPWLIMRSNWQRRENPHDLAEAQPRSIRDAEAAFRLSNHPLVRQRALESLGAAQRSAAANRRLSVETRKKYRQSAMDTMRHLLRLDPGAPRMWEWGQELAQLLEEDAASETVPSADQRRMINDAVGYMHMALAYAPPDQRQDLEQFRDDLIRQGAKADPKRKLAEPK
jgi:tetratricopeptide (TPR) repeat protein